MSAHTPGPWVAETSGLPLAVTTEDGRHLATVYPSRDEGRANARLIAAAPDLLAALRTMVDAFNVKDIDPLVAFASIERARAAICKATESAR
jgi:hypothetical protein